jgi:hypothetical protein
MNRRLKIGLVIATPLLGAVMLPFAWSRFERWGVGLHQQSVTRELARWEEEYAKVRSNAEAVRAIDMLRYIERYYVPADGYHSEPVNEAALEAQRRKTMSAIVAALEQFTGKPFGLDLAKWDACRERLDNSPLPSR